MRNGGKPLRAEGLVIRRASVEEAADAVSILREVTQWLVDTGRPLWPLNSLDVAAFRRAASKGELVLGYEDSQAVACMLLQPRDDIHWPNDTPGEALYVHKLAVRRAAAGQGWSRRLIEWASAQAREAGARVLRLDTSDRHELVPLYERYGFRVIDAVPRRFGPLTIVRLKLRAPEGESNEL